MPVTGVPATTVDPVASLVTALNNATTASTAATAAQTSATSALTTATASSLQKTSNLSDLANAATARTNLGLGSASLLSSSAVLQASNNLSDLGNTATALSNLGLDTTYAPVVAGMSPGARRPPRALKSFITTFQSGHGWTAFTGTTGYSITDDTSDYELGTQSRKITLPATSSASASDRRTGLTAVDLTGKDLAILVKCDRPDLLSTITLYVGSGGLANYYALTAVAGNVSANSTVLHTDEWQWVHFTFASQSSTGGSPSKLAITDYQVTAAATSAGSAQVNVHMGAIGYFTPQAAYPNGVVTFTFDDSYVSQYTNAVPVLDTYGYPGNAFNIIDKIDASGGLTTTQLERMQEKHGWSIGAHAYTTANHNTGWTNLSSSTVETELRLGRQWLLDRGFRGADFYAYPGGLEDKTTVDLVRKYHSFARVVNNLPRQSTTPEELGLRIRAYPMNSTVSTGTTTGLIDSAYTNGWWLVLYTHDVVASGASGTSQYNKASLQTVVDYCNTKPIPVRTVEEVMADI